MNGSNMDGVFSAIRSLCLVLGTVLAAHGLATSGLYFWIETIGGSVMIVGPAVWGVVSAILRVLKLQEATTCGVAAGMLAAKAGAMSAVDPASLTHDAASDVVKVFAPKNLNPTSKETTP